MCPSSATRRSSSRFFMPEGEERRHQTDPVDPPPFGELNERNILFDPSIGLDRSRIQKVAIGQGARRLLEAVTTLDRNSFSLQAHWNTAAAPGCALSATRRVVDRQVTHLDMASSWASSADEVPLYYE
ncbi:hypothetical protein VTI28DRAFT_9958 [Corynascus sepedonium]